MIFLISDENANYRALVGVHHRLERKHPQRYLDQIIWRWNRRGPETKMRTRESSSWSSSSTTTTTWKMIPVGDQMHGLQFNDPRDAPHTRVGPPAPLVVRRPMGYR